MKTSPSLVSDSNNCSGGDGPHAAYVGFSVKNATTGTLTNLQATLSGFATGFALAGGQPATQFVGTLNAGQMRTVYWYISYPCHTATPISSTLSVTVQDGSSGSVTGSATVTARNTISANAGGLISSTLLGPGAVVGQSLTFDVKYSFGNVSSGDEFNLQPAGTTTYNAACFQLTDALIVSSVVPGITALTTDTLYFTATGSKGGSSNFVTVRYYIRYLCANTTTNALPYASQTSGSTNLKYSGNFGSSTGTSSFPSATNPLTISKAVSPTSLPTSGGTVTYSVTISNPSALNVLIDQITDVLPTGVTFQGLTVDSGVTGANSASIPAVGATGTVQWKAIPNTAYSIAAGGTLTLKYTALVSSGSRFATNSVYATIGSATTPTASATLTVGSPPIQIQGTVWDDRNGSVTIDGSPAETGTNTGSSSLTVYALNASGDVIGKSLVNADGTYTITALPMGVAYTLRLSNDSSFNLSLAGPSASSLPTGWVNTGESNGTSTETTTPGDLTTAVTTGSLTNQNFGIDKLPNTDNVTALSQTNPGGTSRVRVPTLTFTDLEDTAGAAATASEICIESLPGNADLYYNNVQITAVPSCIAGYDPALLTIDPIDGDQTVTFTVAAKDAAGQKDPSAATLSMTFAAPVTGSSFPCDGTFYQVRSSSTESALLSFSSLGGSASSVWTSNATVGLNGLAFNRNDGFLYAFRTGVAASSRDLYKLGGSGPVSVGTVVYSTGGAYDLTNSFTITGATFDSAGHLFFVGQGSGNLTPNAIYRVDSFADSDSGTAGVQIAVAQIYTFTGTVENVGDIAFGPDGNLYGATGTNLYQFALGAGTASVSQKTIPTVTGIGSAFFDSNYNFYVYANGSQTLYKVDFSFGSNFASDAATSSNAGTIPYGGSPALPASIGSTDGASCTVPTNSISGKVWNDKNGSITIDGTPLEAGTNAGGLTVYALNSSGNVVAKATVAVDGTYTLFGLNAGTYTLRLSTDASAAVGSPAPATSSLPSGWVNTGENKSGTTETVTPGEIGITVVSSDFANMDFGIEQSPTATAVNAASQNNPGGSSLVTVPALGGTDPEDGTLGTGNTIIISSLATNGTLSYDGTPVTLGQVISGYDPSKLKIDPDNGAVTVGFTYQVRDAAGKDSPAVTVSMPFTNLPPVASDVSNPTITVNAAATGINALQATDPDDGVASYTLVTLPNPAHGILYMTDGTTPVTAGQVLTPAEAASLKFDPSGTYVGDASFTFSATDFNDASDVSPATFTIPIGNTPPTATDVSTSSLASTAGATTIDPLLATDVDGTVASFTVSSLPPAAQGVLFMADGTTPVTAGQVLTPAEAASLKFDPSGTYVGNVTFTFTATDNNGAVDATPATYTIPVSNTPPVAVDVTNSSLSVGAGPTTLATGLSATDSDGTIASYTISSLPPAAQGALYLADGVTAVTLGQVLTVAEAAGLKFDPSGSFAGTVTFTYTATDNNGASDATPNTYSIPLSNNPPIANNVTNVSISSTAGVTAISSLDAADADGSIASYTVLTLPPVSQGVLYLSDGVTAVTAGQVLTPTEAGGLKFDPSGTYTGDATFTFTATDNLGLIDATAATYTIPIGNNPPTANDVTNSSLSVGAGPTTLNAGFSANDTDGIISSYTVVTLPPAAQGTLYLADGTTAVTVGQVLTAAEAAGLQFDPSGSFAGTVTFTYTATDNSGAPDASPATYSIPLGNTPPVATDVTNLSIPSTASATTIAPLAATDSDGTIANYTVVTLPLASQGVLYLADGTTAVTAGQVLTPAEASSLKFDPVGTFTGSSTFTFTATDNLGATDATPANYTIPVGNNPPTAADVTNSSMAVNAGPTTLATGLAATDTDGTISSHTVVTLPLAANGVLYLSDGTTAVTVGQVLTPAEAAGLRFDPSGTFVGDVTFTYTATDNNGLVDSTPATYTIPVVNNPPVTTNITTSSIASSAGPTAIDPLSATDSDGTIASYTVSSLPPSSQGVLYLVDGTTAVTLGQVLTPAQASSLRFDPSGSFTGNVTFTFTATDNNGTVDSTPATYTIPVGNNPPVATDVTSASLPSTAEPTTISSLAATDTDGTVASYTVSSLPPASQGTLYMADGTTAITLGQVLIPAEASSLKFDPSGTYTGNVTLTFTATDDLGAVDATPATYTIPVGNNPPVASNVTTASVPSTGAATSVSSLAATDTDGTIASYTISSLPAASEGVLYLADSLTAVTAGQVLTPVEAGGLKFDPSSTFTGNSTFTFTATDNLGAVDATPATYTIPVGNNPPTAADVTNSSLGVDAGPNTLNTGFAATDSDGTISSYTVSSLPPAVQGTLYLADGTTAVTAGQVLTPAEAAGLKFDPSGSFTGTVTFTYTATDNLGLVDATPATYSIPLANNLPVASNVTTASMTSTAGPITISSLAATDSDGTVASFTVVTLPTAAQGVLYLSDGVTAVTLGQVLTPAQAASLRFDPAGTSNGNVTFTFTATDNLGAVDATPATYTIPVTNNPPTANDVTNSSLSVGAGPTTLAAGFSANDTDGTISSYTVVTLPPAAQGTLYLADGITAVTAGQVFTPAEAAGLKFDPSGSFVGTVTFTYTATDNDGAPDATPATYSIPLSNNPPIATDVTNASIASSAAATTIDPLAATDSDGTIASFTVVTLPPASEGILYLADGTTAVTLGQVLTPAQAGNLKFDPSGAFTGSSSFTFTATDNNGLSDATPAIYTIPVGNNPPNALNVTNSSVAVNAGPTTLATGLAGTDSDGTIASFTVVTLPPAAQGTLYLADGTTAVTAGQTLTPAEAAGLRFDPSGTFAGDVTFTYRVTDNDGLIDSSPATYTVPVVNTPPIATDVTTSSIASSAGPTAIDALAATDTDGTIDSYTVSSLPAAAHGVLYLSDGTTAVIAGQILTPTQASSLKFDPSGSFTGNSTFTFTATDNNGAVDATPATFTVPVGNNPPTAVDVTNASINTNAGPTAISGLNANDTDGTIVSYTISSLPPAAQGTLFLADGTTVVTIGQVLTPTQAAGLKFDPDGSFAGNVTFTFTATDNNATSDTTPATLTIPLTNTAPVANNVTASSVPSNAGPTAISTLSATDADGTISSYTVSTLPPVAQGVLYLSDGVTAVTAGQVLSPAQASSLKFDPSGTTNGNVTFTFTATDNTGAVDATPATYTIPVTNTPPIADDVTNGSSIPASSGPTTIDALSANDLDGTVSSYTLSTLPPAAQGILYLADGTTAVTAGQVLTPAQAASLKFDPSGAFNGNVTFTYTATDDQGSSDATPATFVIPLGNVPPVAAAVANPAISVAAGSTSISILIASDADGTISSYTISTLPPTIQGKLYLTDGTTAVTLGQVLTPAQASTLKFDPSGTFVGNVTFTYTATDNDGSSDASPATFSIPVTNVPPTATNVTNLSISSTAGPTAISSLAASDVDGTIASYTISSLPPASQGVLYLADGVTALTVGQVLTPAQAAGLKFDPSGIATGDVTFTFSATDNNSAIDASPATYTIPVGNNPPVSIDVTNASLSVGAGPTTISSLAATDTDGTIASFTVSSLPSAGQGILYLADGTTAVTAGQVLTPAQASSLKFDPTGTFAGNVTFTFTATDNDGATDATPATFTIPLGNQPPVATDVTTSSIPSSAAATSIDPLAATDSDGTIASFTISSLPLVSEGVLYLANGTTAITVGQVLTPAQASSLKFDPNGAFTGVSTFNFTATDNLGLVDAIPAVYSIPVGNNPPVAQTITNSSLSVAAGPTTLNTGLAGTDADGTVASYTILTLPTATQGVLYLADGTTAVTAGQVLTPAEAAGLKFDPSGTFVGNTTFTYTATDNNGLIDGSAATYTIPVINLPPTATNVTTSSIASGAGPTTIDGLAATDTDGTISSYTVSTLPPAAQGVLFLADGTTAITLGQVLTPAQALSLKFDPSGTFVGVVNFTFTATDNNGASDASPDTYSIPVGNTPPVASNVTTASLASTAGPSVISSLAATDIDGTVVSYTVSSLPLASQGVLFLADGVSAVTAGQVLTPAQAGSLKFDPSGSFTGNVTFTFTATDNDGAVDGTPATYTIPVGNQPPTASDVTNPNISVAAGPTTISSLAASDTDGTISSYTVSSLPPAAQGTLYLADGVTAVTAGQVLTPAQAGSLKFDPSGSFTGNVTFTFTATDNDGAVDASPATFTIPLGNLAPTATNVTTLSIPSSSGPTTIDPLAASDTDGTIASYTVSSLPLAGQGVLYLADGITPVTLGQVLTPAEAASLKFDPSGTFTGNVTFSFTATDNLGAVDATPASYTIPVGNNPPTASNVTNAAVSVGAGPTTLTTGLAATDSDGTITSYTISSLPPAAQGTLFLADGVTVVTAGQVLTPAQAAGLKFDPSGTFSGDVTFTYIATDNLGLVDSSPATYTIPLTNEPPIASDVTTSSIPSSAAASAINPLAATDADGTIFSYTVLTLPPASEGVLYLVDGTTAVTVGQVLTPAEASSLKFDPAGTFTGVSTFTFTATDNLGLVDLSPALYSIPVGNNPPVAQTITNSSLSVAAGPTTLVTGLAATDADGTIASHTVLTLPSAAQGTLFLADGVTAVTAGQVLTPAQAAGLKFDPSGNFAGDVTFTYTATDNAGLTDSSAATYTIPLTNTPPVATDVTTSSIASSAGPTAIDPLAALDTDGTVASFTVVALPPAAHGVLYLVDGTTPVALGQVLTPAQASSLKFDPSGTFVGNVNFTFTSTDNLGLVDPSAATYTIPVGNVPPVANDVTNPAISVSAGPTAILGLDATDSDGTISSFTVVALPPAAHGTLFLSDGTTAVTAGQILTPAQAASLRFDPSGTFSGNTTFTFNATDNDGATGSSPATFNIPLGNNPPVANSDTNASIPSSAGPTAINALTATDTDGTVVSYTVLTLPPAGAGVLYLADGTTAVTAGQILTPAEASSLKFDPAPSFTGNTTFTFTATDNTGATDLSAASVTIPVGNNPPVANDVNASAMPSSAGPTDVSPLNGSDTDGTIVSFTISSLPLASQGLLLMPDGLTPVTAGQVLTPGEAANLKFDPTGSFNGNVTFTYTTTDNLGLTDATPATVTIPVSNTPPVANNVINPTLAGTAGPTTISSLDATDADGAISSYTVLTLPPAAQGTLFLADGTTPVTAGQVLTPAQAASLTFDPSGTFTGNVTFTFTATDNQTAVDVTPATYTIPVGNNPPVASDISNASLSSGAGPATISSLAATDSDGTVVSYKISSLPTAAQGTLFLADGVTAVTVGQVLTPAQAGSLKFDPSGIFAGNATFTYTATDNDGADDPSPATFTIPVTNQPPVAADVTTASVASSAAASAIDPLAATDADGTISSFTIVTLPSTAQGVLYLADGTTTVTAGQVLTPSQASSLKFDPSPSFTGNASFTFSATDNLGLVDATPATYTIPVGNNPPVANSDTNASILSSAGPTTINALTATDTDGTIANYTVLTLPSTAQGVLYLADGTTPVVVGQVLTPVQASSLKFDPASSFAGNATFTFTATDNSGANDPSAATITIPVGNTPPVASDVSNSSIPSNAGPTTINPLAATDTDGSIASYTVVTLPPAAQGTLYFADGITPVTLGQVLTPAQAATLKFDPAPTFSGNATFTFTATDNNGAVDSTPATVTIPVGNTPPTAAPIVAPSLSSSAGPTALPALTGTDPDGTVSSIRIMTLPPIAQGVLTLNGTPVIVGQVLTPAEATNLKFDPAPSFTGDAGFQFTVTDNSGNTSSPANVTIPVVAGPTVTKTFASTTVAADGTVVMSVTITNPNSTSMNGVAFNDAFPSGLEIATAPTVAQCAGTVSSTATSLSLSGGTIPANSSCTINVTVKPTKIGAITNTLLAGAVTTTNAGSSPAPASATLETASVGAAKSASVLNNGDGTYNITYLITLQNLGSVQLTNVQAVESLETTFTGAATWTIVGTPSITSGTGLTLNPSFSGRVAGSTNLLTAASSTLAVGATSTISLTVRVNPNGNPTTTTYNNQVKTTAIGNGPGGATPAVTDLSSNSGTNPDPNGNGNPNEPGESDPTGVSFSENPSIGAAKSAGAVTSNGNGTYTQAFTVIVRNYGDVPLSNLNVSEDLSSVFGAALVSTNNLTVIGAAGVSANAGFNGVAQTNLAATSSTLAVGATATFTFEVVIRPSATAASFTNSVTARGSSPGGSIIADDSVNGLDPNPTPGTPSNDTSGTPIVFAKVTGHVFSDINGNGTQEAGEPNLNGDTVTVTPVTGLAFTVLIDTNGDYTAIVPVGSTKLEATAPVGNLVTTANNPQNINAIAGSNASTAVGFQPKGTIKGHVWTDLNAGGSQQPAEPNANGLIVTITDSSGATQTVITDANGDYSASVPFGPVTATVTLPPGSRLTTANNPQTITITDTSVQTLSPVGYHQDGLISGLIFEDLDGNGLQNTGENGLSGIPVKITDSTGKVVTVLTDATGAYSLAVPAGSTTIEVVTPGGTLLTTGNGTQNVTAVSKTETKATKIGFQPQNKVVGHVFNDPNGNGVQDAGETNIANQDLNVTDSSGAVQTVKTNATGDYVAFVIPGKTTVNVIDPTGSSLTTANDPQDLTVLAGQTSTATPVGFQARGTLSGHLFNDVDGNGLQGPGEPNLPGLTVTITDANGTTITLISDANGDYATSVPAGSTTVTVAGPNGAIATTGNNPQTVTVPVGGNINPTPIGFQVQGGALTGLIFNDANGNGVLDTDEKGIEGVTVTVLDSSGQTFNLITDANGNYSVPILATGAAKITVTDPSGLALTTNNNEQTLSIPSGSSATAANVGYVKPSLQLSKRALSPQVAIGEILGYELIVTNSSPIDVRDVVLIDELPLGIAYKVGSSTVAGLKLEPKLESKNGRQILTWTVPGILTPSASSTIKFATVVTPSATQKLENVATASAIAGASGASTLKVAAQSAVATTKIVQAVFNNKSVFVGRVYFDRDLDANFTSGTDVPLAGARVYLSDGRYAITDAQGRYSVPNVTPGVYVVRLDRLTAPYIPVRVPTDVGLPGTRRVDAQGGLYEANFPLLEPDANVAKERETLVERGNVKLEKTLERLPTDATQTDATQTDASQTGASQNAKPGYVIRETITVSKAVGNLTITDPLPQGATRDTILLVGSDGKEITVKLLEDGRIEIPGTLEAGTYTLVYAIYTNLTPDQVVTDPSINYDEVIR